ncbi:hypothetical protein [Companilactobacillus sp.]|uniref:hypothetical protein n=1 Tax=Companilactobacillus sp. TaxID=2767905 RepID=UPI002620FA0D|nr:hypothetical protein [Companilactobacillus sp.]
MKKILSTLKHWFLSNIDTMLFLLALVIIDVNSYHFGSLVGNYVVAASLFIVTYLLNKPQK